MKLKKISAYSLSRKMKNSEVVVFGTGQRLKSMCEDFFECNFEKKIAYAVDNNSKLWNSTKKIGEVEITIKSPEYLANNVKSNTIVIITTDRIAEVFAQLQNYQSLQGCTCYRFPMYRKKTATVFNSLFKKMPLKNYIMLQGEGDSCENAMALTEYILQHDIKERYKIIWLCSHPERFRSNKYIKYINRRAELEEKKLVKVWEYYYYRCVSKYLMYENKFIQKMRPEQKSIYLKHGTFMLKDVKGKIVIPSNVNYAICTSENYADLAAEQESINKERLMFCGSPRLDFLYQDKSVLKTMEIEKDNYRYIVWLPTMRQATFSAMRIDTKKAFSYGIPVVQTEEDFARLNAALENNKLKLIIKPHPRQDLSVFKISAYDNIIFMPQKKLDEHMITIHSLMRETVALISDYSSIAFDYMLLNRPIAYTVDDMGEYIVGFSVENPLDYMPGEKIATIEDMLNFIENVANEKDVFYEQRNRIKDYIHKFQDENNCERFIEMLEM